MDTNWTDLVSAAVAAIAGAVLSYFFGPPNRRARK